MTKIAIVTDHAPRPTGAYSQGVIAGEFLFTAGFGPQHPVTGVIEPGIAAQTRQVLQNVEAVVREAGATMADVVKTTVHLQELKRDFAEYDAVYREFFPVPCPARTTVGSQLYDILVEIDVVVHLPSGLSDSGSLDPVARSR